MKQGELDPANGREQPTKSVKLVDSVGMKNLGLDVAMFSNPNITGDQVKMLII